MRLSGLEHRDVGALIATDYLRLKMPVVEQRHRNLARIFDDVTVCDDVAVLGVYNHARAGALELAAAYGSALGDIKESSKIGIIAQRIARHPLGQRTAGRDVDHGG